MAAALTSAPLDTPRERDGNAAYGGEVAMAIATLILRLVVLLLALAPAGQVLAQEAETEFLHYKFDPPLGTDIIQSVETASVLTTPDAKRMENWTHEVVIRLERRDGDEFAGTFQLRNVVNLQNAEDDVYYLIAKALEDQIYSLRMADIGLAIEVDWSAIRPRIEEQLPRLTDPAKAAAVKAVLSAFSDHTQAVLRPINAAAQSYFLPFRRDGGLSERDDFGPATYFALDPAKVEVVGGLDQEANALILDWLVTSAPEVATAALGTQMRSIVSLADPQSTTGGSNIIEAAIAEGVEAAEDGYAIYEPEKGMMREVSINAVMVAGDFAHVTAYKLMRLSP